MNDFLINFHKRMEKLSYSYLIDSKAATLSFFKDYFSDVDLINIIYTLMVFILERSLKDEECTLSDMSVFIGGIIHEFYNPEITEDEVKNLTHDIVYKILRNDGKPFVFTTYDYQNKKSYSYSYHLVQQKTSQNDPNKSTFYLEREGYRLILNSLEVDEKTQIDINQMILELSLRKKNFSQGLMAVEKLNRLITIQIINIKNFIFKMRENIFSISNDDLENNYVKNIEILKEQNKHFYELYEIISREEERIYQVEMVELEKFDSLKQLSTIKETLKSITDKASQLISYHFKFKEEYEEALERYSTYYNNRRINIREHLLKPVELDARKLGSIHTIFSPLFRKDHTKIFNPNIIFNNQDLYAKDEDEVEISFEENQESKEEEKIKHDCAEYESIVSTLLSFIIKKKETSLKELIDHYENKTNEEYLKLVPSVRKFAEVLIELLRLGDISISNIISEEQKKYITREIAFDLRKILVAEFANNYTYHNINHLMFAKDSDSVTTEVRKRKPSNGDEIKMVEVLSCPNIIMKVK